MRKGGGDGRMMRWRGKLRGGERCSRKGCIKQLKFGSSRMKGRDDFSCNCHSNDCKERDANDNSMLYICMLL